MTNLNGTRITWLGHGTFQITTVQGKVILIDPWLETNPACPPDHKHVERVDLLLVTHGHGDHTEDLLAVAKAHSPTVVAIAELAKWLGGQGVEKLVDLNIGGSYTAEGVTLTLTRAIHTSSVDVNGQSLYVGEPTGFIIRSEGAPTLYFAGDTDVFGDMSLIRELHAPDIAFLPIGDYYTMGPKAAAKAVQLLGVKQVIPMHYATFPILIGRPQALREELQKLGLGDVEVIDIEPGQTIA
jgi:L-ascorbate metabolism protein UlaG (beta-lactamase superfamily)